ncbi:MAG: hypothetical protein IKC80_00015 [Kiritimatiellae bacterium]|nr:hypothetical protein [Kiritimatiellia bacterium]
MKKLIMTAAIAAVACGCITVNKNDGGESNMKVKVCKDMIHEKIAVEDKQITAQDQIHCLFGFICWGSSATHVADQTDDLFSLGMQVKAKNGAYANACDAGKCDQLVGTRYKITTEDYFVYAKCKAEVTGYPAKVTGVEVVTPPCVRDAKGCCKKTCAK